MYCRPGQVVLKNGTGIIKWGRYCKVGQLLSITK